METDLITNKFNTNYTDIVKQTYLFLRDRYKYSARVSDIWRYLLEIYGKEEYDALDYEYVQNGTLTSWLIDRQVDWQNGEDVNFSEIYRALQAAGDLTGSEKLLFESGGIEERLWAIYLVVTAPELEITIT